jgi:hypothetical protein
MHDTHTHIAWVIISTFGSTFSSWANTFVVARDVEAGTFTTQERIYATLINVSRAVWAFKSCKSYLGTSAQQRNTQLMKRPRMKKTEFRNKDQNGIV